MVDRAQAYSQIPRARTNRCRVDVRAAIFTECLLALVSTSTGLQVYLWLAADESESTFRRNDNRTKCTAGKNLAIRAMTYEHSFRVDICFESYCTAMAASVDLQGTPPSLTEFMGYVRSNLYSGHWTIIVAKQKVEVFADPDGGSLHRVSVSSGRAAAWLQHKAAPSPGSGSGGKGRCG